MDIFRAHDHEGETEAAYWPDIAGEVDESMAPATRAGLGQSDDYERGVRDGYRQAAIRCLNLIKRSLSHINVNSVAWWQIAYAIDHPACEGRPMGDIASKLGVTRAAISKGALQFCDANGLAPSGYLRSEEARATFKRKNGKRKQ